MELSKHYTPQDIESRWYKHWHQSGYFRSTPDEREPYTIVIPPPNVTGVLHMGHLLNNTVQDILIRRARQNGYNALWVPGTDHASIATEAKVVKMLRERGIKKSDISREAFLGYAFEWKEKYGGIILEQLQRLGASCDWERTRFTMEPKLSAAVIKAFVALQQKGKIYRGQRMINWDPEAQTVLSSEEVIFAEEQAKLYQVRYAIEGADNEWITVATTRPETIMGDTAIAVHPDDPRYTHLRGKRAIVPIVGRSVPIIFDAYVLQDFGTGALKVTPAHDTNDYELGIKYELEVIDVFTPDAKISEAAQYYIGLDRFVARKQVAKDLTASGDLVATTDYKNKVGRSERTNAIIEPRLSRHWFVDMQQLATPALDAVMQGEVEFLPEHFKSTYKYWMENIRDWCISRQLWWGQRVPAWYPATAVGEAQTDLFFVAETEAEAYAQYHAYCEENNVTPTALTQDEDVLDTWFSSWLWPISVFDGFEDTTELAYYYPTSTLVTGFDIIFFWVARMIMAGYEFMPALLPNTPQRPFKQVYFTGMVRDSFRRKMSKSLGNSPDALVLLDKYGADGVRFGMLYCSPAGGDLVFDAPFDKATQSIVNESALCEQGRNFCNKLWNALRLIKGWEVTDTATAEQLAVNDLAYTWITQKLAKTLGEVDALLKDFRLSEALKTVYNFIWDDFCAWYLEMIKPAYEQPIHRLALANTLDIFEKLMVMLHPFMPFVTEEIWHNLRPREAGNDCFVQLAIPIQTFDNELLKSVSTAIEVIQRVRELRSKNSLSPRTTLPLFVQNTASAQALLTQAGWRDMVVKLGNLTALTLTDTEPAHAVSFIGGTDNYYALLDIEIDTAAETTRLAAELDYLRGFVASVEKKLSNERFVQNAKPDIIATERKKLADGLAKIAILEDSLAKMG